jgi:Kef-type K+ transport system membrane component KefB
MDKGTKMILVGLIFWLFIALVFHSLEAALVIGAYFAGLLIGRALPDLDKSQGDTT